MKLTIQKIYRSFKDKNNNPLKTRDGREYERVAIQTKEHGSKWVSGFGSRDNQNWKEGDVVEVEVEEKGEYLNFRKPDPIKALEERVAKLEQQVWITSNDSEDAPQTPKNPDEDDIKLEDIPFN